MQIKHSNDTECSVPTTDKNTDITDANTTIPDHNIDDFDEFVSIEIPNDNTNDNVTFNHTNQNDSVPVWHTRQSVQVVLPKQNQIVKYCHGQNPQETVTMLGRAGNRKGKYKNRLNVINDSEQYSIDWVDIDEWQLILMNGSQLNTPKILKSLNSVKILKMKQILCQTVTYYQKVTGSESL